MTHAELRREVSFTLAKVKILLDEHKGRRDEEDDLLCRNQVPKILRVVERQAARGSINVEYIGWPWWGYRRYSVLADYCKTLGLKAYAHCGDEDRNSYLSIDITPGE